MVAAASAPKSRAASSRTPQRSRSFGAWVIIGVPVLLGVFFLWQLLSPLLRTEIITRSPVAVSRVSLESDPQGSRVDFVIVDRSGSDTTVNGAVTVKVREPDGTLWQTTRGVSGGDFTALPMGSLLGGRTGYSVVVPAVDWARAPRRGGAATITVTVQPGDGAEPFSTVAEERFP
jgi:hypothetical protein